MLRFLALLLFLIPLTARAEEPVEAKKQPLLGDWLLVAEETRGSELAQKLKANVNRVSIDAETITAGRAANYKADSAKNQIDITIEGGPKAEQGTYLGIYELTEDRLVIHLAPPGQPRPTAFEAKPTTVLMTLTKKSKKD